MFPLLPIMYRAYPPPPSDQELRRVMLCHVSVVIRVGLAAAADVAVTAPVLSLTVSDGPMPSWTCPDSTCTRPLVIPDIVWLLATTSDCTSPPAIRPEYRRATALAVPSASPNVPAA